VGPTKPLGTRDSFLMGGGEVKAARI
jgi:hypothetical protein